MGPFPTRLSALEEIENWRKDSRSLLLAAIDVRRESVGLDSFAGVYGLIEYNVEAKVSSVPFSHYYPSQF